MRVLELADKKIFGRMLSGSEPFTKEDLKESPTLVLGSSGEIKKVMAQSPDDTLVVLRKDRLNTPFVNGGLTDTTTRNLRNDLYGEDIRSGRNVGLVVLSDPKQEWIEAKRPNPYSFKYKKVDSSDESNRDDLLLEDHTKLILAPERQEDLDEQIVSIVNHFTQVIQSK